MRIVTFAILTISVSVVLLCDCLPSCTKAVADDPADDAALTSKLEPQMEMSQVAHQVNPAMPPLLAPTTSHVRSRTPNQLPEMVQKKGLDSIQPKAAQVRVWGKPVEGQAISIATEKSVYDVGEEITLNVYLANLGRYDVGPPMGDPWKFPTALSIFLPDGRMIPLTLEGQRLIQNCANLAGSGQCFVPYCKLLHGHEMITGGVISSPFFDLSRAGTYTAVLRMKTLKPGGGVSEAEAISNKFQFTVADIAGERLKELAAKSPNVRYLDINMTYITDDGLRYLKDLRQVQYLSLEHAHNITDVGLEHLNGVIGLQLLGLDGTRITDAGLEHLKGLTNLRGLGLADTPVTDDGIAFLSGLTALNDLDLSRTKITDAGIKHLQGLTKLQNILIADTEISDVGLAELVALRKPPQSDLAQTTIPGPGFKSFNGPIGLQKLDLGGTRITDAGLEHLKGLTQLKELSLGGTRATGAGLQSIVGLINLQRLDLRGIPVTDAQLESLKGLRQLRTLCLGKAVHFDHGVYQVGALNDGLVGWAEAGVTREGMKRLQASLPDCKIFGIGDPADQPSSR